MQTTTGGIKGATERIQLTTEIMGGETEGMKGGT
jgi:hypothetical protein